MLHSEEPKTDIILNGTWAASLSVPVISYEIQSVLFPVLWNVFYYTYGVWSVFLSLLELFN